MDCVCRRAMPLRFLMAMRFSIVVPTLNRKEMLISAIESIRAQSWPQVEIMDLEHRDRRRWVEQISLLNQRANEG